MSKWIDSVLKSQIHVSLIHLSKNTRNLKVLGGRLYRWIADNNRPINRPFFHRLIGIGRTLFDTQFLHF